MKKRTLPQLLRAIGGCEICTEDLPLGPRPVVQWKKRPSVVIIGQAPGTKVHESGVPWEDDSGNHLREWLGLEREQFYDGSLVGLMPMGFCYPGKNSGGDAAPDPRCAPNWHSELLGHAKRDALVLLVGTYAQAYYLESERKKSMTETVRNFADYLPRYLPLPHPSWRSKIWMKKNPWFALKVLPALRTEIRSRVQPGA